MSTHSRIATLAGGISLGVILVLSCSDDSPGDADAAACDCPAAEPPITAGRIVKKELASSPIPPGINSGQGVLCDPGGILLGGGCEFADAPLDSGGIYLVVSGVTASGAWDCGWHNASATETYHMKAQAICLMPP